MGSDREELITSLSKFGGLMKKNNLLLIVGPTAVGKTVLSLRIAKQFQGEIISEIPMQIYKEMNIGTAKATCKEREQIPHHLIDLYDTNTLFSLEEYQSLAKKIINEIHQRNHLPMIVGGTGLYIESVTEGYRLPHVQEDTQIREELTKFADVHGNVGSHQRLFKIDPITARNVHPNDRKSVIRALQIYYVSGQLFSEIKKKEAVSQYECLWIGLMMPREKLYERINQRVDQMIEEGLIEEVARLKEQGFSQCLTSMQAIGYKEIMLYLEGKLNLPTAIELIKQGTRKYAKRQLSWFKRVKDMKWYDVTKEGVIQQIETIIAGKFF